jgi:hypothetical protein
MRETRALLKAMVLGLSEKQGLPGCSVPLQVPARQSMAVSTLYLWLGGVVSFSSTPQVLNGSGVTAMPIGLRSTLIWCVAWVPPHAHV